MLGLCMPTGETYLLLKDGTKDSIMINDEFHPRKFIMNDEYVLKAVKRNGYQNVEAIIYEWGNNTTRVSIADYYAEHGQELEG